MIENVKYVLQSLTYKVQLIIVLLIRAIIIDKSRNAVDSIIINDSKNWRIGRRAKIEWPARPPDLAQLDILLWDLIEKYSLHYYKILIN